MAPKTSEQYEEIRESRQHQIMEAAMELFAERGYQNTSVNQIAIKCKISKGLMYNYFGSKEELLQKIIYGILDHFLEMFDMDKNGVLTKQELIDFINQSFEMIEKDARFWKLYFAILVQPAVFAMFQEKFMDLLMPFLELLTNYYRSQGSENPEAEARLFGAMLDGVGFDFILDEKNFPMEEVKKLIIQKFAN